MRLTRVLNALEYRLFRRRSGPVREAVSKLRREWEAEKISRRTLSRFASLGRGLKLNLGCGPDIREGWVNIDIDLSWNRSRLPEFYNYDLRHGIPLPDHSASIIHSSHFWEHLSNEEGLSLFRESLRVLEPSGTFRIALPDQERQCRLYLERDWTHIRKYFDLRESFPDLEPEAVTYGDWQDFALYQWGQHVCYYDVERTIRVLRCIGFREVRESEYLEGVDVDNEVRRFGSFYVTALK